MIGRRLAALAALALVAAGCGSGGGSPAPPTIAPAKEYKLDWQGPQSVAEPGKTTLHFAVRTPDGKILTRFRTGAGPHTGVHLIIVRDDLSTIVHKHPPIPASGRLALPVVLPRAGRYHVLVDVYPASGSLRNFQLTHELQVGTGNVKAAAARVRPGRARRRADVPGRQAAGVAVGGACVDDRERDRRGRQARDVQAVLRRARACDLLPRRLARLLPLAHLRQRPGLQRPASGRLATTGHSTKPGRLELGVLLPASGTLAALPPGLPRGQTDHGSVYAESAMRRSEHLAGFSLGPRARGPGRPRARLCRDADAARGQLGGPRLPGDHVRRAGAGRRDLARRALARRARRARAPRARPAPRPGSAPRAGALLPGRRRCSAAARCSVSPRSRPGCTRARACTCTGGCASRARCTATRSRSCSPSRSRPRRCWPRCATRSAWARRVVHVLRRLLQPRAARRPQALVLGRLTAPAWLLARALRARGPPALFFP